VPIPTHRPTHTHTFVHMPRTSIYEGMLVHPSMRACDLSRILRAGPKNVVF
jgi:hypothetical protein